MNESTEIPAPWRERNPLMSTAGYENLMRVLQHAAAPRWNFATGDRLIGEDLPLVEAYRELALGAQAAALNTRAVPSAAMLDQIRDLRDRVWWYEDNIPADLDLERDWATLPTTSREDLSARLETMVPWDLEDLSRLIAYDTSGTTGHAVRLPHHPRMLAQNHPLAERALARHGAALGFDASMVACANICAQNSTYVFANPFTVWNDAAFVKVNLNAADWAAGRMSAAQYLADLAPQIVTSDPISLAEAMRWGIALKPRAVFSTAVSLSPELAARVSDYFGCPVIDWYSTTETGPIAFSSPDGDGYELTAPDLFVEVVDTAGHPVPDGELGEVCVTGGRNPFVPLFRYRTGDFARLRRGESTRLYDLHGRGVVLFRAADGSLVNAVDIGRAMRLRSLFVQHQFLQRSDGSCEVRVRPLRGVGIDAAGMRADLAALFGGQRVAVHVDTQLGDDAPGGKIAPYLSELEVGQP